MKIEIGDTVFSSNLNENVVITRITTKHRMLRYHFMFEGTEWFSYSEDLTLINKNPKTLDSKNDAIDFLKWCNKPMIRNGNELAFRLRVKPLYPDYNEFLVIDEKGNNIHPDNRFYNYDELYDEYLKTKK